MPKARSAVANVWNPPNPGFTTNFSTVENPVSAGGRLVNLGAPANGGTRAQVVSAGKCCGTNVGSGYDDSYAHALGFETYKNYFAEFVVGVAPGLTNDGISREVELHLWANSDNGSGFRTLEVDISYLFVAVPLVRWNGTFGDFTVASGSFTPTGAPQTGDRFRASFVNNVITLTQNSVSCGSVNLTTDSSIGSSTLYQGGGNPGAGWFIRPGANNTDFWISEFTCGTL
jgi:hypothetical protein